MLALTYPDGARVQRCDYLAEKPRIQRLVIDRISLINEIDSDLSNSRVDYAARFNSSRRRSSRGADLKRRKNTTNLIDHHGLESFHEPSSAFPLRGFNCDANQSRDFCTSDQDEDQDRKFTGYHASSQSRRIHSEDEARCRRLSILKVDDEGSSSSAYDFSTRRRELPGRESWPGGSHPKDRCSNFLQFVLIIALIIIGYNRHCGTPFGARVSQRTAFGVFAFGTVIGRGHTAPVADILTDTGIRSERSANLSHITGTSRKIQMYIKHRHLQILPDGTVNGSNDDTSDYTILQRASVSRGQLRIQGVATCLYLCMDSCGLLYGSHEYTEDCVFNETLEQHNYNTYSSAHWSTPRKTLYLGLSGRGQPRRVQAKGHNLGRLSAYARVLTQVVAPDRVEALHRRMMGARHNVRHHHGSQQSICPAPTPQEKDGRDKFRCRKRKKRKKRRRKCRPGELPGPQCDLRETGTGPSPEAQSKRSCEGAAVEEACRREALDAPSKKRKSRIEDEPQESQEEIHDPQDEDVTLEPKSRRSNEKGTRKKPKGKPGGGQANPGKKSGGKKRKPSTKGDRNPTKLLKKRGSNHPQNRFTRTTALQRLGSSPAVTSPISWSSEPTSPTIFAEYSPAQERQAAPGIFTDRPKSLSSSSSSSVSAVSLAATSIASTLTLTVASAEVFSEDGGARGPKTEGVLDPEEFADVKDFDDEEEEERDEDEDEREDDRTDFAGFGISSRTNTADNQGEEANRRLAM